MEEKQKKINVTFRKNKKEEDLYNWLKERGQIGGVSNFIKTELNKIKESEEAKK